MFPLTDHASPALRRHLSVPPKLAAECSRSYVDGGLSHPAPRLRFMALQHFRHGAPFLAPPFREASGSRCPDSRKCRPQGLATLSTVSACPRPGGCISTPNAPGLRPTELCSFPAIGMTLSDHPFRSCAFLSNPFGPDTGAPAVCSREESRTHSIAPRGINPRQGLVLS
jgi:hypothetical protein